MMVSIDLRTLRSARWQPYALRFLLGGLVTAAAGLLARGFGPAFGGLFLAFPAIFPAAATLIAQRERERKACHGLNGERRGRQAASIDAAGTVLGAIGLLCFALVVWKGLSRYPPLVVLPVAALLWLACSMALWWLQKMHKRLTHPHA